MNRAVAAVLAVVVVLASAGLGIGAWLLARDAAPDQLQISAYTRGQLTRVGPFLYCNVLNLDDCQTPQAQGQLVVDERNPVQLSVPEQIGAAPWRLMQVYQDPANTTITSFRPNSRLAVTIPTVDPHRGRMTGFTVQLLTLVVDQNGELHEAPHAEWSVRTDWAS
ncbi:DUF2771 domain-containing protein [Mycolicibacterium komossense]|uniref:DUF2771 domain-containing protein n=1 Tax=Mycolicibacterium komossense TaxID=1779 RepID=A0ABT3CE13_9MYCO|nr:DUF2771 domain-containing protein [Mycolicibacterium komossense]MCV7227613.1 DUF2771 domain-containing protein [Mycolicibacterium komossense]